MKWINEAAQQFIEYILVFVAVIMMLVFALAPNGYLTKGIDDALNSSIKGVEVMPACARYDVNGNPVARVCGNRCCEGGEDHNNCPQDCPCIPNCVCAAAIPSFERCRNSCDTGWCSGTGP
jgi:hypothetical protein